MINKSINKHLLIKIFLYAILSMCLCFKITSQEGETQSEIQNIEKQEEILQQEVELIQEVELAQEVEKIVQEIQIEKKNNPEEEAKNFHPLVKKQIEQYTSNFAKDWLNTVMTESLKYRAFVQKTLEENNMPKNLQYLPVIESSYKISALSKSGAYGMWQFMKNSIAPFNIRINSWMDERKDPWLTTKAAIKKLKENYDYLGSWELALAAYNCGLGAMTRTIKKAGSSDFWYLAEKGFLKTETKNYVPKFLAISHILDNKDFYGLDFPEPNEETDNCTNFEEISVKRSIDLGILAEKSDIEKELLSFYNPSLYYNVTPPDTTYNLRIPKEKKQEVETLLASSNLPLIKYHVYTVKSGDSLYALSKHYEIPVSEIQKVNKLSGTIIKIGQKLMIPAIKDVAKFTGAKQPEKVVFNGKHKVTEKDTLWNLSLKYNVQVEVLAEENNMEIDDILRIGSEIKVPIIEL